MALLIQTGAMVERWASALAAYDPTLDLRIHPDLGDPAQIDCLLSWKPPLGLLPRLSGLRLLQCSGAGVDQLLSNTEIPPGLPISRIIDQQQADDLAVFALTVTLAWFRRIDAYRAQQAAGRWEPLFPHPTVSDVTIGVMGLGSMGQTVARRFADCGFRVIGWRQQRADLPGITCFAGPDELAPFLAQTNVLVCVLPLTPETVGILSYERLARLARPAFLVNIGRGAHLVEAGLLRALDERIVDGAALDVFGTEPLPPEHPFWRHPAVRLTPHIAAYATPERVVPQVVENLRRVRRGETPANLVDLARGY